MQRNQLILEKLTGIESMLAEQTVKPLTFREAATYLDVSMSHLYKLTSQGKIPHSKPAGKRIYFSKPELDKWLLRNPVKTTEQIEQEAATHVVNSGRKGAA